MAFRPDLPPDAPPVSPGIGGASASDGESAGNRGRLALDAADGGRAREAEQAQWFCGLLAAVPGAVALVDCSGLVAAVNSEFAQLFGFPEAELPGRAWKELFPGYGGAHSREPGFGRRSDGSIFRAEARWGAASGPLGLRCVAVEAVRDDGRRRRAEEGRKAAEEQLHLIVDVVPALISYVDRDGVYRLNNRAYETRFGHERSEITGKRVRDVLGEDAWKRVEPHFTAALEGKESRFEAQWGVDHNGVPVWDSIAYVPDRGADGEVRGVAVLVTDISRIKQAENALQLQARLLEISQDAIFLWRDPGGIQTWNHGAAELYGIPREEAVGRMPHELLRTQFPQPKPQIEAALREQGSWKGEFRHFTRAGEELIVSSHLQRIPEASGALLVLENNRDMTEMRRAQAALAASEQRFALAVEASGTGVWDWDVRAEKVYYSRQWKRQLGFEESEISDRPGEWEDRIHPADRERTFSLLCKHLFNPCEPFQIELRMRHRDGSWRWMLMRGMALLDEQSHPWRMVGSQLDLTEHLETKEALRQANETLLLAQTAIGSGVWGWDIARGSFYMSPQYRDLIGLAPDTVMTPELWNRIVHPADRERIALQMRELFSRGENWRAEYRIFHPSRGLCWILGLGRLTRNAAGRPVRMSGISVDITERKLAEERLRLSEDRLRFAARATGFGSFEFDFITGEAHWSSEMKGLFGLGPDEPFEVDEHMLPAYLFADDHARVLQLTRESLDPLGPGLVEVEHRIRRKDGVVRWLMLRGRTFFEGEGQEARPVRISGILFDITERKELEQEILEISSREQQRVGQDLHDDLCQWLTGVEMQLLAAGGRLAERGDPDAPQMEKLAGYVREACVRARMLARGLAAVAIEVSGLPTALEELAASVERMFRVRCWCECDPGAFVGETQKALHLYRIAQEAVSNGIRHGRATELRIRLMRTENRSAVLRIRDNGSGLPQGAAARPGMGWRIMRYRAGIVGGALEVRRSDSGGVEIVCTFPRS